MSTFMYITKSNPAPLFPDTERGFIDAADAEQALEITIRNYRHRAGLLSAEIREVSKENALLARYKKKTKGAPAPSALQ